MALQRNAILAACDKCTVLLATIAQIAVVVLKVPQLSSSRCKVVIKQSIMQRLGVQWVGICHHDEVAEVDPDLFTIGRVRPIQVINV